MSQESRTEAELLRELLVRWEALEKYLAKPLPEILNSEQARWELGDISEGKLRSMHRRGQIRRCRVGDGWGYPRKEIERIRDDLDLPPLPPRRGGGRPKSKRYSAKDEAAKLEEALRKPRPPIE